MRASQFLISTLKEAPADADVVSQQLMLRAGMIKKLRPVSTRICPLGCVDPQDRGDHPRGMNRAGAIELL